jgi:SAM-dependent methyltransferase
MNLQRLQHEWDELARTDPMRAILGRPGEGKPWDAAEFFRIGVLEIDEAMQYAGTLGLPRQRGAALDFGCGAGRLTQALAGHFEVVTGIDVSPAMLELAERYNEQGERCRFVCNRSARLERFPDGAFDFIYSAITLQHLRPSLTRGYLREFVRVLAPGGLLLFNLPSHRTSPWMARAMPGNSYARLSSLGRRLLSNGRPVIEMNGIRPGTVVRLVEQAGGQVLAHQCRESAGAAWTSYQYAVTKAAGEALQGGIVK